MHTLNFKTENLTDIVDDLVFKFSNSSIGAGIANQEGQFCAARFDKEVNIERLSALLASLTDLSQVIDSEVLHDKNTETILESPHGYFIIHPVNHQYFIVLVVNKAVNMTAAKAELVKAAFKVKHIV